MMRRTRAMAAELLAGTPGERGKSPEERRRHVRVEVQLEVGFSIAGDAVKSLTSAVTHDISHGGACLAVSDCPDHLVEKLAARPLLEILIDIPRAAPVHQRQGALSSLNGRVEWLRRPVKPGLPVLIGIEFSGLDVATENAIIDLIAHLVLDAQDLFFARVTPPGKPAA